MEFKGKFQILGAKGFKGEVEGTNYDSTTIYVVMPVSERAGTEKGFNAHPIKFGKSDEFAKMKNLPFPIEAELDLTLTTKGYECHGFKPLSVSHAKNAASAAS
ncbi:MAG: hypothetical protein H3C26_12340 [Rhodocyclaceae bacterium]|nr:hypothetical protein [Rhodocyclaceae bacterium]